MHSTKKLCTLFNPNTALKNKINKWTKWQIFTWYPRVRFNRLCHHIMIYEIIILIFLIMFYLAANRRRSLPLAHPERHRQDHEHQARPCTQDLQRHSHLEKLRGELIWLKNSTWKWDLNETVLWEHWKLFQNRHHLYNLWMKNRWIDHVMCYSLV